jgi:hypothetical protein
MIKVATVGRMVSRMEVMVAPFERVGVKKIRVGLPGYYDLADPSASLRMTAFLLRYWPHRTAKSDEAKVELAGAAAGEKLLTSEPCGVVGREEDCDVGDVLGLADATERGG